MALLGSRKMELGHWLTLAGVTIAFINLLINISKELRDRRKAKEGLAKPQDRLEPAETWPGKYIDSFILPLIVIALALVSLIIEVRDTHAITRKTTFYMALDMGLIVFQILHMIIMSWRDRIYARLEQVYSLNHLQTEAIQRISTNVSRSHNVDQKNFDEA
jgi:hypothetical protein